MRAVNYNPKLRLQLLLILLSISIIANIFGSYFTRFFIAEITILSIFAISLDFIASRGGMVSLGHAMFLGIGAYSTAILSINYGISPLSSTLSTFIIGVVIGLIIGYFIVFLDGIFFIMVTLALGEMFNAWVFTSDFLGGSDGISGIIRPDFSQIGIDMNNPLTFSFYVILWLLGIYFLLTKITDAPLGRNLDAIRQNSHRISAIGGYTKAYKAIAFSLSAGIASIAGSLYVQLNGFISPELTHWTVSGEGLIMIIVGGIGSISGAILGATVVHIIQHELSNIINWWMLVIGFGFIFIVLFMEDGLWGLLERIQKKLK
ncbi:MAG TPA: branched-chain amino acid ABC transporter permease [Alphaproteobacteria bacterium]|jgi:branched-chain amino acid transport system permease protein|nr:branched-chain amino acid ABC transporter permease [Alphaproteobacteria bacterium]HIK87101.1 branched-chain amino acid ABC transporter permease [Alphaproteobacteria bacterium]